jgi:glycosyltransferase involved in cell wall biosynthesis
MNLSIITPTYNSAKTVEQTFKSIEKLVLLGAEHIIVDSYSTDGTLEICSRFKCKILKYPKGNMYKAINFGINHSSNSFITYINSDDLLNSDGILSALKIAFENDIVYGNVSFINENGLKLFDRRTLPVWILKYTARYFNPIFQQGMLFSKKTYDTLGGFNDKLMYSADMDFVINSIYSDCRIIKCNKILGSFRLSRNQLSSKEWPYMKLEGPIIRNTLHAKYAIKVGIFSKVISRLIRYFYNTDLILIGILKKVAVNN